MTEGKSFTAGLVLGLYIVFAILFFGIGFPMLLDTQIWVVQAMAIILAGGIIGFFVYKTYTFFKAVNRMDL